MLTITPAAAEFLKRDLIDMGEPGDGIRVFVASGGLSGQQYGFDFGPRQIDDHVLAPLAGLDVAVDRSSGVADCVV